MIINHFETIINQEMESIQLNIKLIRANIQGHFTLNKIIVRDARSSIDQSKQAIKTLSGLKYKYEETLELNTK